MNQFLKELFSDTGSASMMRILCFGLFVVATVYLFVATTPFPWTIYLYSLSFGGKIGQKIIEGNGNDETPPTP